jgi:hypothetical protein
MLVSQFCEIPTYKVVSFKRGHPSYKATFFYRTEIPTYKVVPFKRGHPSYKATFNYRTEIPTY